MSTPQRGRPCQDAPSKTSIELKSTNPADTRWWENVSWWEHPATAYARGVEDGVRLADERFVVWLMAVLPSVIGVPTLGDCFTALNRYRDQVAARGGSPW